PGGDSVAPGLAVVRVTGATSSIRLPTTGDGATAIVGVLGRPESTIEPNDGTPGQENKIPPGRYVPVVLEGAIWAEPEAAVTAGNPLHVRLDGSGQPGALRGSESSSNTVAVTNAVWATDSVEINGRL